MHPLDNETRSEFVGDDDTSLEQGIRQAGADESEHERQSDRVEIPRTRSQLLNEPPPDGYFPGYKVVRGLDAGGEGVVYEAVQEATKGKVAVKALIGGARATARAKKRFEREIELIVQLKHPNIVSLYEAGTTSDGLPFYVMDYIKGATLDEYVRQKQLSLEDTLRLLATVCRAVEHFHRKGVIHRDLKPENILVDNLGVPRIVDFGLAKLLVGPVDLTISVTQEIKGTLRYMSPEQAGGRVEEVDTRSDVYALGVVMYELLTGGFPYPVNGSLTDILNHICNTPPLSPRRAWRSSVDLLAHAESSHHGTQYSFGKDVEMILLTALEKDPDHRYQSALALAEDLEHYLRNEPILPHVSRFYRVRKFVQRSKTPLTVAAAVFLIVLFSAYAKVEANWAKINAAAKERELRAWTMANRVFFAGGKLHQTDTMLRQVNTMVESDSTTALPRALRSLVLFEKGRYRQAQTDAREAIMLDTDRGLAYMLGSYVDGHWHLRELDFGGAESAYGNALNSMMTTMDLPRGFHNLAKARRFLGKYRSALEDADRAVALAPTKPLVWAGRGVSKRMLSDIPGAIMDFRQAAGLPAGWTVQGNLMIWETLMLRDGPGDRNAAKQALSAAAAAKSNDSSDQLCLSICLGELSDDQALAQAMKETQRFLAHYLGARSRVLGDNEAAESHFEKCVKLGGQSDAVKTEGYLESDLAHWHLIKLRQD